MSSVASCTREGSAWHRSILRVVSTLGLVLAAHTTPLLARQLVVPVAVSRSIDTSAAPIRALVGTVRAYYLLPSPGHTQTPLWNAEERHHLSLYDLGTIAYGAGFPPTIVSVAPATPDSSMYVIKTFFARGDSAHGIDALALQRLYARRDRSAPFGWELLGALGVETRDWATATVGDITYHYHGGTPFDTAQADSANRFLDSASRRVGVARPGHINYYVATSWDEVQRLSGFDWVAGNPSFGGRAFPEDMILLSGSPRWGEFFAHELAHLVLAKVGPADRRHRLVEEGVATWLGGGTLGRSPESYFGMVRAYQLALPDVTFSAMLRRSDAEEVFYGTGALIAEEVNQRGGLLALHRLLQAGPTDADLFQALPALLGVAPDGLDRWWHDAARRLAPANTTAALYPVDSAPTRNSNKGPSFQPER